MVAKRSLESTDSESVKRQALASPEHDETESPNSLFDSPEGSTASAGDSRTTSAPQHAPGYAAGVARSIQSGEDTLGTIRPAVDTTIACPRSTARRALALADDPSEPDSSDDDSGINLDGEPADPPDSAGPVWRRPYHPPVSFFKTYLDPYRDQHRNVMPRGFENDFNKCYRNSVMIALLGSGYFRAYLNHWLPSMDRRATIKSSDSHAVLLLQFLDNVRREMFTLRKPIPKRLDVAMCKFWSAVHQEEDGLGAPLDDLSCWKSWSSTMGPTYMPDQQQSAGEFLIWILRAVDSQLGRNYAFASSCDKQDLFTAEQGNFRAAFRHVFTKRHWCTNCGTNRLRIPDSSISEYVWNVYLTAEDETCGRLVTLRQVLTRDLRGESNIRCPVYCGGRDTTHIHEKRIQQPPRTLFIQINRAPPAYELWDPDVSPRKNQTQVEIPEYLQVGPWLEPHMYKEGSKMRYQLKTMVVHNGAHTDSGHYYTLFRTRASSTDWVIVNDRNVEMVNLADYNDSQERLYSEDGAVDERQATPVLLVYDMISHPDPGYEGSTGRDARGVWTTQEAAAHKAWSDYWEDFVKLQGAERRIQRFQMQHA